MAATAAAARTDCTHTEELLARDPRFRPWVERLGPLELPRVERVDLYGALSRAVIGQQLSGKAAAAIVARVRTALGGAFTPGRVRRVPLAALRAAGLSGQKAATLKALAAHARTPQWPRSEEMAALSDAELIERLTVVRGVGVWTVQMLLIFTLGRPDVLPATDLGIRKGLMRLDELDRLPTPREVEARGAPWRPYSSLASLYLWRSLDGPAALP